MKATPNYNTHFSAIPMAPKARFTEQQTLIPASNYGYNQQKMIRPIPIAGYSSSLPKVILEQPRQIIRNEPSYSSSYGPAVLAKTNPTPAQYGQIFTQQPEGKPSTLVADMS